MPTATSNPTPAEPPRESPRQSNAIQKGADTLLDLFNEEKSQLTLLYRQNLDKLVGQFKTHAEAQLASTNSQLSKKTALLENLSTQYDRSVQDLEATRNELQQVRAEYAKLLSSIEDVGLVYVNGILHFNDPTAKIVSHFREGARMQDMVISHMNPDLDNDATLDDNIEVIKPSDFFVFLSGVMAKGQRYTHGLDHEFEQDLKLAWPGPY